MDKKERAERNKKYEERYGIAPVTLGSLAYLGTPVYLSPLQMIANTLEEGARSGVAIESAPGTKLKNIAEFTDDEVKQIAAFAKRQGVKVPILAAHPHFQGNAYFQSKPSLMERVIRRFAKPEDVAKLDKALPPKPHIGLGQSSVPTALHEIGHATSLPGGAATNAISREMRRTIFHPHMQTIGSALLAANLLSRPDEDSSEVRQFAYEHAPALTAAMQVPGLAEEARASYHAIRGARDVGVSTGQVIKELAPAFGTYVAKAAIPVLAIMLAKKVMEALHRQGEEIQQAEEAAPAEEKQAMAGAEVKAPGLLRNAASAAWRMGSSAPKAKTTVPGGPAARARSNPVAKPPSKNAFYRDMLESLYNPQRGARLTTG
jgi:hypothetical protein